MLNINGDNETRGIHFVLVELKKKSSHADIQVEGVVLTFETERCLWIAGLIRVNQLKGSFANKRHKLRFQGDPWPLGTEILKLSIDDIHQWMEFAPLLLGIF